MTRVLQEEVVGILPFQCFGETDYSLYVLIPKVEVPDDWTPPKSVEEALDWYVD